MPDRVPGVPSPIARRLAWRIALIFVVIGSLWLLVSDLLLPILIGDAAHYEAIQLVKDWVAILVVAGLLYWLIRLSYRTADQALSTLGSEIKTRQQVEAALAQSEETEHKARLLAEALRDTAEALTSTLDVEEVLDRILANVGRVVPHDGADIMLIDEASGSARIVRYRSYTESISTNWIEQLTFSVSDTYNLRTMTETGQPMVIPLTHSQPGWLDFPETHWIQSYVGAPIRVKGRVVGFLNLDNSRPNYYTTEHASILQALADQAATAIENARLFQATQRRWREQAALLAASNAMSSSLDLPVVLTQVAEQMGRALDATSAYICYWNPANNSTRIVAEYYSEAASDAERAPYAGEDYEDEIEFLLRREPVIRHIDDPTTPVATRDHLREFGAQSLLALPLIAKDITYGYVSIWESRRRRDFTAEDIQLSQALAQQAAIAFYNARLFDDERRQLTLARTLQAVGALLTAEMTLDEVFERVFDLLAEVVRYDAVSIELYDEHGEFALAAQRGYPDPEQVRHTTRHVTGPTVRERWGSSGAIVVADTRHDPRWLPLPEFAFIRARVGAWLRVRNRSFGLLNIDSYTPNAYDDATGETAMAFANQAAIAIENAQLSAAIREQAARLSERVAERTSELERERKRLQAILDAAGDGIVFTDPHGLIEYVNPALEKLTGYTAAESLGQTARMWKSGHSPDSVYDQMWQTIARGEIWLGELVNRHKDGHVYDAAVTVAPLFGADEAIIGYVGIQRDVTHRKELERLKDQFVSNVSHELRTPLANVKLYLSLLERGLPEKRAQYLETLQREANRLEKLIEALLDISRLDLGATHIHTLATEIGPLLAQLNSDRAGLAAQRDLVLDYVPRADLPLVLIDANLFTQVISNLLSNAISYTPAGGRISIRTDRVTAPDGDWVTVTVRDTGPGISAADRPHVFERFYRGEAGRRSGAPGTGLGLSICQEIVTRMGGRLTLDSQPGQGATFTVWLKITP